MRYRTGKYFLPFSALFFIFLIMSFEEHTFYILRKSNLYILFYCIFVSYLRSPLSNLRSQRLSLFSFKSFIILIFIFQSLIHFKLIFVCDLCSLFPFIFCSRFDYLLRSCFMSTLTYQQQFCIFISLYFVKYFCTFISLYFVKYFCVL